MQVPEPMNEGQRHGLTLKMMKKIKNSPLTLFVNSGPKFVNNRPELQPCQIKFSLI